MKIIFFGTDENAKLVLRDLHLSSHNVVLVVTVSDKIRSRGTKKTPTPIKEYCLESKINCVDQMPEASDLKNLNPDVIVVASYGRIIPDEIINLPKYGALNLHPSLLPKYRGPSPVHAAIKNGDHITGVSIIVLSKELDAGPIVEQASQAIEKSDNLKTLTKSLFVKGSNIIKKVLDNPSKIKDSEEQDHSLSVMTKKISKEDAHIDWSKPGIKIINHVRAFDDKSAAYSFIDGKRMKVYKSLFLDNAAPPNHVFMGNHGGHSRPKGALGVDMQGNLVVTVCDGMIIIQELQLEGRSRMKGSEFARGYFPPDPKGHVGRCLEKSLS
ncbi:MAG: methionyl-tRNA formyltransferase [Chloroflexota bacterium]|nr:methionyl-tRNA formyltransferase [Chloroflexota bacterium]|tara:strand:+ start:3048 stop:4025 length:978 start_codon:yes stop_codon:yes gene_type:complete